MGHLAPNQVLQLFQGEGSVNQRLAALHDRVLQTMPAISRIACALYEQPTDLLKTFINSTREGQALHGYEAKLSDCGDLKQLASTGSYRVIDEIALQVYRGNQHSDWLLSQPYRSSFTVPMYDNGGFLGFIFFDSTQPGYFDARVQRDLLLYCNLINMALSAELSAVRAVLVSAQVAREFVDLRDFETGAHLERMAQYARLIAKGVAADYQLSDETIEHIYLFAPLHDIGKIGIPDHILLKQGPLTSDERVFMQTHVEKGEQLMQKVIGDFGLHHLPDSEIMRHIVACHHEFLDGSGYPRGLRGDEIPAEARIVTVADIFDALTSQRPYKQPWSVEAALQELRTMADLGKLDRLCVEALAGQLATAQWIARHYVDKLPDELAKTTG
jgi:HD-GYP domain-containing protein (c-di-GMP phosphodiesterase class II)